MTPKRIIDLTETQVKNNLIEVRRNLLLDFIRGLSILDMMFVHYREYLNLVPGLNISKLIGYSDFAIEGFTFLAGFLVGSHYFQKFRQQRVQVIKRLVQRSAELLAIYYIMVFTISLPLVLLLGSSLTGSETSLVYILRSLLLQNQVGLLHILPTFIPLFLLAIPTLYLLEKGYDLIVLAISIGSFALGHFQPYLLSLGDKTIFPVVLWQIYFILGILLGKRHISIENRSAKNKYVNLFVAVGTLSVGCFFYYGHHIYPFMSEIRDGYGIQVVKFPLNYLGLLYYGSIFFVVFSLTVVFWNRIQKWKGAVDVVTLFGRHSLLVFIIHVYFAKTLVLTGHIFGNPFPLPQVVIAANVCTTIAILGYKEARGSEGKLAVTSLSH